MLIELQQQKSGYRCCGAGAELLFLKLAHDSEFGNCSGADFDSPFIILFEQVKELLGLQEQLGCQLALYLFASVCRSVYE